MLGRCSEPRGREAKGGSGCGLSVPPASAKQKGKRRETLALLWCHQESNRGHKDFQSFALPTELWHHWQFFFFGAEATRFELVVRLPVRQFSKLLVSATHPHFHRILLLNCTAKIIRFFDLCKYFALSLPTAPPRQRPARLRAASTRGQEAPHQATRIEPHCPSRPPPTPRAKRLPKAHELARLARVPYIYAPSQSSGAYSRSPG